MRTARVVGLSPDGKSLIVATDGGEELAVAADESLHAAMRGDRPRLGQLENEMNTALSPREIQTRIRAGQSLEDVARVAGLPLDRVERFAAPVLAEREHIAALALSSSVRRRGESSGHRSLRLTVTERLVTRGVDIDEIAWDSHRLEDGRWTVTAGYTAAAEARHAGFVFDPRGRFSVAGDDEARWLLGEPSRVVGPPAVRRPGAVDDEEDTEPTLDLNDELAIVRATQEPGSSGVRATQEPGSSGVRATQQPGSAGVPVTQEPEASATRPVPAPPRPGGVSDATAVPVTQAGGWEPPLVTAIPAEPAATPEPAPVDTEEVPAAAVAQPAPLEVAPPVDPVPAAEEPRRTRKKRASVPSWDEIMFGGPRPSS